MTRTVVTRRSLLIAGAAALATPYVWSRAAPGMRRNAARLVSVQKR